MRFGVAFLALSASCTPPSPDGRFLLPGGEEDFGRGPGSSGVDAGEDAASAVDMSSAAAVDMVTSADLGPAVSGDMAQECGKEPGESCCAGLCEVRDPQSRFLVCRASVCELCGVQGAYCCAGNICYGGTSCAPPTSMYAGTCR